MSDNDDPFGRRDRTIIRPNPGGRRPTPAEPPPPQQPPAPRPAGGAPPASRPTSGMAYPTPPTPAQPASFGADMWMSGAPAASASPYLQSHAAATPMTPAPALPHISVDLGTVTSSPLMRAAASLLLLLGRLRASLSRGGAAQLMDQIAQAIQQFEVDARAAGAPRDQVEAGKYALAATADDIVQNLPGEVGVYTQYSMLVRFFQERTGGVKFFQELDRAKQNPSVNISLLELMHACLSLGFEGVYRAAGGAGALQGIRRDLYDTIRRASPLVDSGLSPHWRGQTIPLADRRFQVPVWAVAAVAAVVLFVTYLVLRNLLIGKVEDLAVQMATVHPAQAVALVHEGYVNKPPPPPPPPPADHVSTQLERIRSALAAEILAGKVSADQTATTIFVRIGSLVLFPVGGANVNDSFAPIARKIASALDKEKGEIHVVGHTDADPIKTVAFPSNFELSVARAKSVAAMLKSDLASPDRVTVQGRGADDPVAPNDVEANKAKNRRVEISVPRQD